MRKWAKISLSLIFLYTLSLCAVFLLALLFSFAILYTFLAIEGLSWLSCIVIFCSRRRDDVKFSWILFIAVVPLVGLISYWLFGRKYKFKMEHSQYYKSLQQKSFINLDKSQIEKQLYKNTFALSQNLNASVSVNNNFSLFPMGVSGLAKMLSDINKAQKFVFLSYYIIAKGEIFSAAMKIIKSLLEKGVKVYIIYDYIGSFHRLHYRDFRKLIKLGLKVKKYGEVRLPFMNRQNNYRNHKKIAIIDGQIAHLGGLNLADEYAGTSEKFGILYDQQLRIKGSGVAAVMNSFTADWYYVTKFSEKLDKLYPEWFKNHQTPENKTPINNIIITGENGPFLTSDNLESFNLDWIIHLISRAKNRIWMSTPYFIPPAKLTGALKLAALSGVDVKLLIPGFNDKTFMLSITRFNCEELFSSGIEIYELNNAFSHSKVALFDDEIITIGSLNMDNRSFFCNQEILATVYDKNLMNNFELLWKWNLEHSYKWDSRFLHSRYNIVKYLGLKLLKIINPIL